MIQYYCELYRITAPCGDRRSARLVLGQGGFLFIRDYLPEEHPENAAIIASAPMIDNTFVFFIDFPSFFIITVLTMGQ